MNVNEVIEKLTELQEKGLGEVQVRVIADHGQTLMEVWAVDETYIEEDSYMPEEVHIDGIGYLDDPIKVVAIAG